MSRGMAVVDEVIRYAESPVAIVTHGNLMALILRMFDEQIGYTEWANLRNPDVYQVQIRDRLVQVDQFPQQAKSENPDAG